jgi:hypothetical protein
MMRRSVQTVILYEAHRCLKDKLPTLRPFQKKLAVFDQAIYLLNDSSLLPHQREEVIYKTVLSKELMNPETMWRRVRKVVNEVKKVAEQVKPLCTKKRTHLEVYYAFLQKNYVSLCPMEMCVSLFTPRGKSSHTPLTIYTLCRSAHPRTRRRGRTANCTRLDGSLLTITTSWHTKCTTTRASLM